MKKGKKNASIKDDKKTSQPEGLLLNKVAFITGGGRGIGAAAAHLFAREGALVMLASRSEPELFKVVEAIRAYGGTAEYCVADVQDSASLNRAVEMAVQHYGRLDIAFNNAGTSIGHVPMTDIAEKDFDSVNTGNFKSIWMSMVAEIKAIRATSKKGAIVNNSSIGSLIGAPGLGAYAATKRAVNSLTQTAAIEYGPEGIRINAIAPGTTMTEMMQKWVAQEPDIIKQLNARTPLGRAADSAEIAEAAAWLLSDRASYVTGCILPVDSGTRA